MIRVQVLVLVLGLLALTAPAVRSLGNLRQSSTTSLGLSNSMGKRSAVAVAVAEQVANTAVVGELRRVPSMAPPRKLTPPTLLELRSTTRRQSSKQRSHSTHGAAVASATALAVAGTAQVGHTNAYCRQFGSCVDCTTKGYGTMMSCGWCTEQRGDNQPRCLGYLDRNKNCPGDVLLAESRTKPHDTCEGHVEPPHPRWPMSLDPAPLDSYDDTEDTQQAHQTEALRPAGKASIHQMAISALKRAAGVRRRPRGGAPVAPKKLTHKTSLELDEALQDDGDDDDDGAQQKQTEALPQPVLKRTHTTHTKKHGFSKGDLVTVTGGGWKGEEATISDVDPLKFKYGGGEYAVDKEAHELVQVTDGTSAAAAT